MKNINFEEAVKLREKIRENFEKLEGMEKEQNIKSYKIFGKEWTLACYQKLLNSE